MKVEDSIVSQSVKERTGDAAEQAEDDHQEEDHTAHKPRSVIDPEELNEAINALTIELEMPTGAEANDKFFRLMVEPSFDQMLNKVCRQVINGYSPGAAYSWEDLKQDVLLKFWPWLYHYEGKASYKTVLRRIALNQLIDVHRRPSERCCSFGDLEIDEDNIGQPQGHAGSDVQDSAQVREWLSKLESEKDRRLFVEYIIEGKTATEIAHERGVTRQAAYKQVRRMLDKLRPYV